MRLVIMAMDPIAHRIIHIMVVVTLIMVLIGPTQDIIADHRIRRIIHMAIATIIIQV